MDELTAGQQNKKQYQAASYTQEEMWVIKCN